MASLIISCFALLWLTYALILKVQLLPVCMLCTRHPVTLIGFVQTLLSNLSTLCNTSINQQPIVLYPLSWNANSLQAFPCTIRNDNATLEVVTKLGDKMVWNSTAQPPGVSYIKHVSKNATPSNILCHVCTHGCIVAIYVALSCIVSNVARCCRCNLGAVSRCI